MLSDKLWNNKYARWVALDVYILGCGMLIASIFITSWIGDLLAEGALVIWMVPVTWCAYKWSKEGK